MHASNPTSLSLYDFARILGFNPLHFAGIDLQEIAGVHCARPLPQYEWQEGDRTARETVGRNIAQAEAMIEEYLGYRVLPSWEVSERIPATQFYRPEWRGLLQSHAYRTRWGHIVEPGVRATTLLAAAAAVAWSDDSYWQIGTVTAPVAAGTEPQEVHIYYPGKGADPAWEIRPAEVTVAGLVATITFRRECAVDQDLWDALEVVAADGDADADFLTTVDVYRVYSDPAESVTYLWEPVGICSCSGAGCDACTMQSQTGCFWTRDQKLGLTITRPGTWADGVFTAATCYTQGRPPDFAELSYRAGYRDLRLATPLRTLDRELARAVAFLAASLLERPPCDCTVDSWEYWREDLTQSENVRYAVQTAGQTPFGTRRGALYAWERVKERTLGQAVLVP